MLVDTVEVEMGLIYGYKWTKRSEDPIPMKKITDNKKALDHFKFFVSRRNITFLRIMFYDKDRHFADIMEILKATVTRPLRVKFLELVNCGEAGLLRFLEPGTLESICLKDVGQGEARKMYRLEQWKRAQRVFLDNRARSKTFISGEIKLISSNISVITNALGCGGWEMKQGDQDKGPKEWSERLFRTDNRGVLVQVFDNKIVFTVKMD